MNPETNTPYSAIDTYLNLLVVKGASDSNIIRRKTFLTILLKDLASLPTTEKVYGAVVEERLRNFGQEEMRHFFQVTAREFYWFLINDAVKVNAYISGAELISVDPFRLHLSDKLDDLYVQADNYFLKSPSSILDSYRDSLPGTEQQVALRMRLARLLLYVFRDFDQHPDMFRAASSAVAEKMPSAVMRETFFVVVREFYPKWISAITPS